MCPVSYLSGRSYNEVRTHLSLGKDAPESRVVHAFARFSRGRFSVVSITSTSGSDLRQGQWLRAPPLMVLLSALRFSWSLPLTLVVFSMPTTGSGCSFACQCALRGDSTCSRGVFRGDPCPRPDRFLC
jgi:hypothetical protein